MEFLYILGGITVIGYIIYRFARKPRKVNGFSIPDGPVSRDMTDPYSQALFAAFDSGLVVSYNAGDEKMKASDLETGEVSEIEFKN